MKIILWRLIKLRSKSSHVHFVSQVVVIIGLMTKYENIVLPLFFLMLRIYFSLARLTSFRDAYYIIWINQLLSTCDTPHLWKWIMIIFISVVFFWISNFPRKFFFARVFFYWKNDCSIKGSVYDVANIGCCGICDANAPADRSVASRLRGRTFDVSLL